VIAETTAAETALIGFCAGENPGLQMHAARAIGFTFRLDHALPHAAGDPWAADAPCRSAKAPAEAHKL
jgi:hypothetical protein